MSMLQQSPKPSRGSTEYECKADKIFSWGGGGGDGMSMLQQSHLGACSPRQKNIFLRSLRLQFRHSRLGGKTSAQ